MSNALERYERSQGWTVLTQEQRATIHGKILFGHTKDEIIRFAKRHDVDFAKSWTKGEIADAIVSALKKSGEDYEILLSMVSTPSSYLERP